MKKKKKSCHKIKKKTQLQSERVLFQTERIGTDIAQNPHMYEFLINHEIGWNYIQYYTYIHISTIQNPQQNTNDDTE